MALRLLRGVLVVGLLGTATVVAPVDVSVAGPVEASPSAEAGSFVEATLWDSTDDDQYANFHVQGLAVVHAGTRPPGAGGALPDDVVLTFTEGRFEVSDAGAKDLLVRRSVDGGRTWSASVPVVPADPAHSWGSATPLVDEQTGRVFLFYKGSGGSVFVKRSDDAGASWTAAEDLSRLFVGGSNGWTRHSPTPGHGIQLRSGRLLMPIAHRAPDPNPNYGIDMLISDQHGDPGTWRRGTSVPVSAAYPINESRVYERGDGAVVINGRWGAGGTRYRITSTSVDGGQTWAAPVADGATGQFVSVDAGLLGYSQDPVSRLLYSRPDSSARENMTVSISYDEGASFRYSRVVNPGPSYYSDLGRLSDGTILLVYGRDGDIPSFPERVSIARFDLEWLTNGRDSLATGPRLTTDEYELATAQARTSTGGSPQTVLDPNARGGRTLRYAAAAVGAYLEAPIEVAQAGRYEVAVRHHRLGDRGRVRTTIDGVGLAGGLVDPTMTVAEGYQVYPLGTVTLAAGTHWVRFTLAGQGRGGGRVIAPDQLMLTSAEVAADPPRVVADNDSIPSFEAAAGTWNRATGVAGYYGQSYRTHPAGTGSALARFRPDVPMAGVYAASIWYTSATNRASNVPVTIRHAEGEATIRLDQRSGGGRWVPLGEYTFVAGGANTIELSDDANGYVIADAVQLAYRGAVADNDAAGFDVVSGTWSRATGVAGFYGESYRTHAAGDGSSVVRWRPEVPVSGVYQVSVWYTAHSNRASNAPFVVRHVSGSTTVRVDQRAGGGRWVSLGRFQFAAGSAASTASVELSDGADGYVIADAVRVVRVS